MSWVSRLFLLIISVCIFFQICIANPDSFSQQFVTAAQERTNHQVIYDGTYQRIAYPLGDIPLSKGVCTDLIVRAYRKLGVDLQQLVHEDMQANFSMYPKIWGLTSTDSNIDHRRVPNLQTFFKRHGKVLKISQNENEYQSGDLVTWMLPGNLPHIGIVSNQLIKNTMRPKNIHNIGRGPVEDDILFKYEITGHYRYGGNSS
jgi:uncharacterized protein YijF (DUF1287 family)